LPVAVALEPVPTQPDAVPSALSTVLSFVLLGLLGLAVSGLIRGERWGYTASAGAAFMLTGMSVACPVTGHHAMGLWWVGQAGIAVGLMALSLAGWQRAGAPAR
jgi:hypothetical protein